MDIVIALLFLVSLVTFAVGVIGLIKPSLVRMRSRGRSLWWVVASLVIFFVAASLIPPIDEEQANTEVVAAPTAAPAEAAPRFASVAAMFEEFSDYPPPEQFRLVNESPLHVELLPYITPNDLDEVKQETVNRAIAYAVFRTFGYFEDIEEITVSVLPMNPYVKPIEPMPDLETSLTVTRDKAMSVLRKYVSVNSAAELFTEKKVGDMSIPDQWIESFNQVYYDGSMKPGVSQFVSELGGQ